MGLQPPVETEQSPSPIKNHRVPICILLSCFCFFLGSQIFVCVNSVLLSFFFYPLLFGENTKFYQKFPSRPSVRFSLFFLLKHFRDSCLKRVVAGLGALYVSVFSHRAGPSFLGREGRRGRAYSSALCGFRGFKIPEPV